MDLVTILRQIDRCRVFAVFRHYYFIAVFVVNFRVIAVHIAGNDSLSSYHKHAIGAVAICAQWLTCRNPIRVERTQTSVHPNHLHFSFILGRRGEFNFHRRRWRTAFRNIFRLPVFDKHRSYTTFHFSWIVKTQYPERSINGVATDVTQRAGTKIPPTAPFERVITWVIINPLCRTYPLLPGNAFGHIGFTNRSRNSLWPYRTVRPDLYCMHRTYQAFIEPLYHLKLSGVRCSLVSHL